MEPLNAAVENMGAMAKQVGIFRGGSAGARLLSKDLERDALVSLCEQDTIDEAIRMKRKQKQNIKYYSVQDQNSKFMFKSVFSDCLEAIPHVEEAMKEAI